MSKRIWCLIVGTLIVSLILARTEADAAAIESFDNKNATLGTFWCDDELIKNMAHQLELQNRAIESLGLKVDMYNLRVDHNAVTMRDKLLDDIKELLEFHRVSGSDLIDVRTNVTPAPTHGNVPKTTTAATVATSEAAIKTTRLPASCEEALHTGAPSGIYQISLPAFEVKPFFVYCLQDPHNGTAWTLIQRRQDGTIDFYRPWNAYQRGFGNLNGEFFLGLDKIHALTHTHLHELWIEMSDFNAVSRHAKYDSFAIGSEGDKYALNILGAFHGDAGDSLSDLQGQKFTTKDADNDVWDKNCAVEFTGAWWYKACHRSNLNGMYLSGEYPKDKFAKGINWHSWHGHYYSLKYVHMAIRRVNRN